MGSPAHPVLALGPQLVLGEPQPQFESLVLPPVDGQLHQVVVHRLLEEFGDLTDGGSDQAVHDGRQMGLERGDRLLHHLDDLSGGSVTVGCQDHEIYGTSLPPILRKFHSFSHNISNLIDRLSVT